MHRTRGQGVTNTHLPGGDGAVCSGLAVPAASLRAPPWVLGPRAGLVACADSLLLQAPALVFCSPSHLLTSNWPPNREQPASMCSHQHLLPSKTVAPGQRRHRTHCRAGGCGRTEAASHASPRHLCRCLLEPSAPLSLGVSPAATAGGQGTRMALLGLRTPVIVPRLWTETHVHSPHRAVSAPGHTDPPQSIRVSRHVTWCIHLVPDL